MNDIIIYSRNTDDHLKHFDEMLIFLKNFGMTLFLKKCHFAYSNIQVLKHHVSRFDLNTLKKKIKTINELKFSVTLKKLKIELRFFEYYRKFVK